MARSPRLTTLTSCSPSSTGSRQTDLSRIRAAASLTVVSGVVAPRSRLLHAAPTVVSGPRFDAVTRTVMSRSVQMPTTRPLSSVTTTAPTSASAICRAASLTELSADPLIGLRNITSATVLAMTLLLPLVATPLRCYHRIGGTVGLPQHRPPGTKSGTSPGETEGRIYRTRSRARRRGDRRPPSTSAWRVPRVRPTEEVHHPSAHRHSHSGDHRSGPVGG
jgi:hypothetical protein